MDKQTLNALKEIASRRPGVGEWSHSTSMWYFQGKAYTDVEQADYMAFNAHLSWSEELCNFIESVEGK